MPATPERLRMAVLVPVNEGRGILALHLHPQVRHEQGLARWLAALTAVGFSSGASTRP